MARRIRPGIDSFSEVSRVYAAAHYPVALTGAGISVESGVPDFRSPGGLWSIFRPEEYATIAVFRSDPAKAWRLYRALGASLVGKQPGPAHRALAALEQAGRLKTVITQNIDGLHSRAGNCNVVEVHGEHQHLNCLLCGYLRPIEELDLKEVGPLPSCPDCHYPLKPNMVLFGEVIRDMPRIEEALERCDLLLVIGTSAQVYPVASFPYVVHQRGGVIFEFNTAATPLTTSADFFFEGKAGTTVPALVEAVLQQQR